MRPICSMAYNKPGFVFSLMRFIHFAKTLILYVDAGIAMSIKMDQGVGGGSLWSM